MGDESTGRGRFTWSNMAKVFHEHVEEFFYVLGGAIAQSSKLVLCIVVVLGGILSVGVTERFTETRVLKLWVEQDSRVTEEAAFFRDNYSDVTRLQLIGLEREGEQDVISKEGLDLMMEVNKELIAFTVDVSDISESVGQVTFQDLCDEPPLPDAIVAGYQAAFGDDLRKFWRFPCIYQRPLECFSEGGFDYLFPLPSQDPAGLAGENPYDSKPSYATSTDLEIRQTLSNVCRNFGNVALPENAWMGGADRGDDEIIDSATSFRIVAGALAPAALKLKFARFGIDVTEQQAEDIELRWESAFTDHFEPLRDDISTRMDGSWRLQMLAARTVDDTIEEAIDASAWLIIVGYLVMGIFAMLTFSNPKDPVRSRALLGFCGVVLVSLSVLASFGVTSFFSIPYNPISTQVLPFLALGLGVDDMFVIGASLKDVAHHLPDPETWTAHALRHAGPSITLTSLVNFVAFMLASVSDINAVKDFSQQSAIVVMVNYFMLLFGFSAMIAIDSRRIANSRMDVLFCKTGKKEATEPEARFVTNFIENVYAPFLSNSTVKMVVVAIFSAFFAISLWGITRSERGLRLADVTEEDTFADDYLLLSQRDYGTFPGALVFSAEDGLKNYQAEILATQEQMQDAFGVFQGAVTVYDLSWIGSLRDGFWTIHEFLLDTNPTATIPDDELPCLATEQCVLPDDYHLPAEYFDAYIEGMLLTVGFSYGPSFIFKELDDGTRTLMTSTQSLALDGLFYTDQITRMMRDTRKATDENGVPTSFPIGLVFELWEQYVHIDDNLWATIGYVMIGVFCVTLVFLMNPSMTVLLALFIFMVEVEIYGMTGFAEIKMNAVTLTNIIMSTAVSVEFTVHLAFAFMVANGTRNERMKTALVHMFAPIFNGAFSTFLGILMLAASPYRYLVTYYFNMYLIMILVGLGNGLVLLPVLLSLLGPGSFGFEKKSVVIPMNELKAADADFNAHPHHNNKV